MERHRIIFSGSGGQGIITASIIIAEAAVLYENLNAVQVQAYGPEARGGATRADVIISDKEIRFPKVIQPNILICLTQKAYDKFLKTIRPGGLLLVDSHFVIPGSRVDARQVSLDIYKTIINDIGNAVVFNIGVLGAFLGLTRIIKPASVIEVLKRRTPPDYFDINIRALEIGLAKAEDIE